MEYQKSEQLYSVTISGLTLDAAKALAEQGSSLVWLREGDKVTAQPDASGKPIVIVPDQEGYRLSQDYAKLFDFISAGHVATAFVNVFFAKGEERIYRDVCKVQRFKPFDILIGTRGIAYGEGYSFSDNDKSEFEIFAMRCQGLSLGWIEPN
jgi:hypothetical protein